MATAKAKSKKRDKKGALYELKKKKQLENQLNSIQGKKLNLETQIMALEDAHLNKETINAMKATIKESDIDKADELMEDINEAMDQVNEMNEAMSQPLGQMMDDDELEAELAELEELEADELLNDGLVEPRAMQQQPAAQISLPDAPSKPIQKQEEDEEEDELAALEAMMN